MSYEQITTAVETKLKSIEGLPPLIGENEAGSVKTTSNKSSRFTTYLRTTMLPAETTEVSIGADGHNRWSGLIQIDLFYPAGDGTALPNKLVQAIIDAFPQKDFLQADDFTIHIRSVWREVGRQETNYYQVPVVLRYECFIPR